MEPKNLTPEKSLQIIGGCLFWVSAVVSFYLPYEINLLVSAFTCVVAYLVPGYLLKRAKD